MRDADDRESNVQIETGGGGKSIYFFFSHNQNYPPKRKSKSKQTPQE